MSSKYYSRIFVGCFCSSYTRKLKQNLCCVRSLSTTFICPRCLVCLYVIQFTRYRLARICKPDWARCELLYSITLKPLCQELFSSFSKFFRRVVVLQKHFLSSHNFFSIPHGVLFVKNFLQVFPILFRLVLRVPLSRTALVY